MKRREWELHLPLDPDGPQHPQLPPLLDHPVEQRGLPDARLSMHHQYPAVAAARTVEQAGEDLALTLPAEQLGSRGLRARRSV